MLRRLRAREVWTPVLILTAKDGQYDETDAFDLSADDYLTKPFRFRVLVARIGALVRRGAPQRPAVLAAGTLTLDPARRVVERDRTPIALTPREFGVLEHLMMKKDTVVSKAEIVASVWDPPFRRTRQHRRGLRPLPAARNRHPFDTNTIETIRGVGYRLLPYRSPAQRRSRAPSVTAAAFSSGAVPMRRLRPSHTCCSCPSERGCMRRRDSWMPTQPEFVRRVAKEDI